MVTRRMGNGRANALKREIVIRVEERPQAPAEVVYDLLADLRSHLVWAGERQGKKTRLVALEARRARPGWEPSSARKARIPWGGSPTSRW